MLARRTMSSTSSGSDSLASKFEPPREGASSYSGNCKNLIAHENGYWHHHIHSENNNSLLSNDRSVQEIYFPEEMMWLKGQNKPQNFGKCTRSNKFLMYNAPVGHQCGCGVKGFTPSHSVWMHNATIKTPAAPNSDYFASSPTLRLAKLLANANATLCFSGDSIDYQIYAAMHNNLRRIDQLHQLYHPGEERLVSVVTREIPVTHKYYTKPGNIDDWFLHGHRPPNGDGSFLNARRPPPGGFGSMYSILETKAHFRDEESEGKLKRARIRYYMSYGWSPWNVDFMEDCNVIVMNLGLHYNSDGVHMGKETRHTLMDDMLAAINYLTNFTASKDNRIAVWRSALPQHFPSHDGHFHGWDKMRKDESCSVVNEGNHTNRHGVYNNVYDEAFSKQCQLEHQIDAATKQPCDHLYRCSVDPRVEKYQTIYKFWRDNNSTEHMERERSRLANLSRIEGKIFRWSLFNLFDVISWHSADLDCSHVCYVPQLFEAAFERLELVLSLPLAHFDMKHRKQ
ncbi:hypothetical protein ACHAXR_005984 [Thalassiosira sp. AJA248-18]